MADSVGGGPRAVPRGRHVGAPGRAPRNPPPLSPATRQQGSRAAVTRAAGWLELPRRGAYPHTTPGRFSDGRQVLMATRTAADGTQKELSYRKRLIEIANAINSAGSIQDILVDIKDKMADL